MNNVKILENTFRDGMYFIDFLIEPKVVQRYVSKFINLGFEYIEIGHGLGLGAYKKFSSGFSDEELLKTCSSLLKRNKIFCFFIPYIGELDDLKKARDYGLHGIRVGMEALYISKYSKIIEEAKNMGFFLVVNIMKSYAVEPKKFPKYLKGIIGLADVIYIVDSAGFMFPKDLKQYILSLYNSFGKLKLGFHGHNNLNLAVANALVAIEHGVEFIDTTLGGIGRSGGNIPTETLIAILNRIGSLNDDDLLFMTLKLSTEFKKFLSSKGRIFKVREEDIVFGYAGFHSSYEEITKECSIKKGIDFNKLVVEVSKKEKVSLTKDMISNIANKLNSDG